MHLSSSKKGVTLASPGIARVEALQKFSHLMYRISLRTVRAEYHRGPTFVSERIFETIQKLFEVMVL